MWQLEAHNAPADTVPYHYSHCVQELGGELAPATWIPSSCCGSASAGAFPPPPSRLLVIVWACCLTRARAEISASRRYRSCEWLSTLLGLETYAGTCLPARITSRAQRCLPVQCCVVNCGVEWVCRRWQVAARRAASTAASGRESDNCCVTSGFNLCVCGTHGVPVAGVVAPQPMHR